MKRNAVLLGFAITLSTLFWSCASESDIATSTETTLLNGRVVDASGHPVAKAFVYLHGDSLSGSSGSQDSYSFTDNSGRKSIRIATDSNGHYDFRGEFKGKAWIEANLCDSLAVLDSIDFGESASTSTKELFLRPIVELRIVISAEQQGSVLHIPELNRTYTVGDTANIVTLKLPAGSYSLFFSGHSFDNSDSLNVVTGNDTIAVVSIVESDSSAHSSSVLANWSFDNNAIPGYDASEIANHAKLGEGSPTVSGGSLLLDGSSGMRVSLSNVYLRNDFAVEARIQASSFGVMDNIVVAEPPGRYGDGWQLRLDTGKVAFHIRDAATHGSDWQILRSPEALTTGTWHIVRAERKGAITRLWVDSVLVASATTQGDIGQLSYDLGIGYDAMNQAFHDRYFKGQIDYVRLYTMDSLAINGSSSSSSAPSSSSSADNACPATTYNATVDKWTAEWSFDSTNTPFQDVSGNGHHASLGEGSPVAAAGILSLDGSSGLVVPVDSAFLSNNFIVEARIKPSAFGTMDNILVMEPPGRYGDGWQLRVDTGSVKFLLRDESTQGSEWIVVDGGRITKDQWVTIRVVRSGCQTEIWMDDTLTANLNVAGNVGQLKYNGGLGYDAMNQSFHNRYFNGQIDYIRYKALP